jgi:TolB-like protein/Tfp pilus assembly protein PilF
VQKSVKSAEIWRAAASDQGRAMPESDNRAYGFERYVLDLRRGCLLNADREVELRPKSFQVLEYLVENAGRLVAKEELIKAVWPHVVVTDESVTRCVSEVRSALDDSEQQIIRTVPRRGYVLAVPVAPASARDQKTPFTGDGRPRLSIVVLPFADLTGDSGQRYLADSITEGLTAYLSRIRDSFVIAHTTASTYHQARALDVRRIGRELGVRYVLEGSAQRTATRVRVNARLVDATSSALVWADQFDVDCGDLFQMQDAILMRLARALHIELAEVEAARVVQPRSILADAEDLALRAEAIFLRYGANRPETEGAYALCEQALETDRSNLRALCILATRFAFRITSAQSTDVEGDMRRAEEYAARARAADRNSYQAHQANARVLLARSRPEEAIAEAEHSLSLNPGFIPAYLDLAAANLYLCRPETVIDYARTAMRLSPADPYEDNFHACAGRAYFMQERYDHAVESMRRPVAINPEFPLHHRFLSASLAQNGEDADAHEAMKRYLSLSGTRIRTVAAYAALPPRSRHRDYLLYRKRLIEGVTKAGMPEK